MLGNGEAGYLRNTWFWKEKRCWRSFFPGFRAEAI